MDIVIIHWKIRPDDTSRQAFLEHWSCKLEVPRANLIGEFLSQPRLEREVDFPCQIFDHNEGVGYVSYFNVGIWTSSEAFRRDVYEPYGERTKLLTFEVALPERMVVSPQRTRIGRARFPKRDKLS